MNYKIMTVMSCKWIFFFTVYYSSVLNISLCFVKNVHSKACLNKIFIRLDKIVTIDI